MKYTDQPSLYSTSSRIYASTLNRQNANASAEEIQEAILSSLRSFQGDVDPEDDVTLVVIKVLGDA